MNEVTPLRLSTVESLRLLKEAMSETPPAALLNMLHSEEPLALLRPRLLPDAEGVSDDDRDNVLLAALEAVSNDMDPEQAGPLTKEQTPRIWAALRRMHGMAQAGSGSATGRPTRLSAAIREPAKTKTADAMRRLAQALATSSSQSAEATAAPAARQAVRTPFHAGRIDKRLLGGMDIMIARATNNQITKAAELFERLESAERRVLELDATAARPQPRVPAPQRLTGEPAPIGGSTQRWETRTVEVRQAFPRDAVFDRPTQPGTGSGAVRIDIDLLLSTKILVLDGGGDPHVPAIDPMYVFDAKTLATAMHALRTRKNLCLVGPTGSGKTKFLEQFAARLGRPYFRISVDGEMRRREIIGGLQQVVTDKGSKTAWYDGLLTVGIQLPSVVNLDEVDRADPDMLYAAAQALEGNGIQLLEDGNRHIPMNPLCMIASTGNTKGQADANGLYASTGEMSEASRDRLNLWVDHDYMDAKAEEAMIMARVPGTSLQDAETIVAIAADIRIAMRDGRIRTACSPRTTVTAAEYLADMVPIMTGANASATKAACLNDVMARRARDPLDAQAIAQMITNRIS